MFCMSLDDSTHDKFNGTITAEKPTSIKWSDGGAEYIVEFTEAWGSHERWGQKNTISAPSVDIPMFVMAMNHEKKEKRFNNASCTTNCSASWPRSSIITLASWRDSRSQSMLSMPLMDDPVEVMSSKKMKQALEGAHRVPWTTLRTRMSLQFSVTPTLPPLMIELPLLLITMLSNLFAGMRMNLTIATGQWTDFMASKEDEAPLDHQNQKAQEAFIS
ncbi:Glyceraldehyde-3-phosphate dehydrogenase, partial [Galemys pyrenaicus]